MINNKYLNKMKDTVNKFYNALKMAKQEIDRNNGIYLPDIAKGENDKVLERLRLAESAAEAEIDATTAEAVEAVEKWKALSGKEIDDADLKLLQGAFKLDNEDIEALVEKHKDNGTMIRAIKDYAEDHNIMAVIPTPEAKIKAYSVIAREAKDTLATIERSITNTEDSFTGFSIENIVGGFLNPETKVFGQNLSVLL